MAMAGQEYRTARFLNTNKNRNFRIEDHGRNPDLVWRDGYDYGFQILMRLTYYRQLIIIVVAIKRRTLKVKQDDFSPFDFFF
jgi:hypothetical protein